ncbi:MAG: hypothetical protein ABJE95_15225 [Byssovorax sp.]
MPDEAILELVKNRLGMAPFRDLSHESRRRRARAPRVVEAAPAPEPAPSPEPKSKRFAAPEKPKARKPRRVASVSSDRKETRESVERVVTASTGVSASEVARAAGIPQPRAAIALKELKLEKRIFQGGDRRFARYAGDAKVAEAASLAARTSASGPVPVKKPPRSKRPKATK